MAQRFLSLEDAAKKLGVTKEKLNELREAGKARAFRDGTSWKFKEEEVDRLVSQGIASPTDEAAAQSATDPATDDVAADGSGAILLSEVELGEDADDQGSSSTIIGQEDQVRQQASDLEGPAADAGTESSDLELDLDTDSNLSLESDGNVRLEGDESNVLSVSAGGSGVLDGSEPEPGSQFEHLEELDLDLDLNSSQLSFAEDSTTSKVEAAAADVGAASEDSGPTEQPAAPPDRAESSIKLAADEDEDDKVVLGDDSASDITLDGEQSGISLADASDTGISLDEAPLDLGGSSAESFDLRSDDTFKVSDQVEPAPEPGGQDDEEFVLTSAEDAGGSSALGSGSHVVAFDLESDVDENTATILGGEPSLGSDLDMQGEAVTAPMLEEETGEPGLDVAAAPAAASAITRTVGLREAQYSGWNITFLVLCVVLLFLSGAMMFDLLRSMWSWKEPYALNSTIMDAILNALF